jgi:hypothetical protein
VTKQTYSVLRNNQTQLSGQRACLPPFQVRIPACTLEDSTLTYSDDDNGKILCAIMVHFQLAFITNRPNLPKIQQKIINNNQRSIQPHHRKKILIGKAVNIEKYAVLQQFFYSYYLF